MSRSPKTNCECGNRLASNSSPICPRCQKMERNAYADLENRKPTPYQLPHAYIHLASGGSFGYNYSRWWEN